MLEECPELEQQYVVVEIEEPNLQRTSRLLRAWSEHQASEHGRQFEEEALQHALQLSNRLLSRSHQPRKSIDLLGQAGSLVPPGQPITAAHVLDRFCTNYKVPRRLVDPSVPLDLTELELYFGSRILGQDEAVGAVVKMISLIKAGLCDARRPFGVFLFVGPTGVGKTHVAQLLAEYLFGNYQLSAFSDQPAPPLCMFVPLPEHLGPEIMRYCSEDSDARTADPQELIADR